jgi:hypothetical protein
MDIPMMDDREWEVVWKAHTVAMQHGRDGRAAALAEYERLTGFRETNFSALFHHRISQHGPPCPRCGKVLRTPVAYKCYECGLQVHNPNWSHLFCLEVDAFAIKGRGVVVVANENSIAGRLLPGSEIEFRDGTRIVSRATLLSIERFHGAPPESKNIGLLVETHVPHTKIKTGQNAWLTRAEPRRPGPV